MKVAVKLLTGVALCATIFVVSEAFTVWWLQELRKCEECEAPLD